MERKLDTFLCSSLWRAYIILLMVSDCCTSQLDMISRDVTRSVRCSSTFTVSPFFEVPDSRYKASGLGSVGLGNARRRRRRTTTRTTPTPRPTPQRQQQRHYHHVANMQISAYLYNLDTCRHRHDIDARITILSPSHRRSITRWDLFMRLVGLVLPSNQH